MTTQADYIHARARLWQTGEWTLDECDRCGCAPCQCPRDEYDPDDDPEYGCRECDDGE